MLSLLLFVVIAVAVYFSCCCLLSLFVLFVCFLLILFSCLLLVVMVAILLFALFVVIVYLFACVCLFFVVCVVCWFVDLFVYCVACLFVSFSFSGFWVVCQPTAAMLLQKSNKDHYCWCNCYCNQQQRTNNHVFVTRRSVASTSKRPSEVPGDQWQALTWQSLTSSGRNSTPFT